MTTREMSERLNILSGKLSTLGQKDDRTTDEDAELDTALAEFNDLGPKVEQALMVQAAAAKAGQLHQRSAGRITAIQPQNGDEANAEGTRPDRRSIGEQFATSEVLKNFVAGGGRTSGRVEVGGMLSRHGGATTTYDGSGPAERLALVASGGQPGHLIPEQVVSGIFRGRDYGLTMRDVLLSGTTTSDTIYFIRELLFTNAAVEVAEATATTGASGTKPESTLTFEEASAPVVTIAHWIPVTRQMLADAAQIRSYIQGRLLTGLERRLDAQILNGNGTAPNMRGILETSGVQLLDNTPTTGYWALNPVTGPATGPTANFNRLRRAMRLIDTVADAQATFIVVNPADLEKFETALSTDNQYLGGGPFARGAVSTIWGLPVVPNRSIAIGTALVGDGTMAQVWDREAGNILVDTINDQFIRNMLTILAELRAALTVYRPAAFAETELAAF